MQLTSNGVRALTVVRILAVLVLAGARCTDSRTADAGQSVAGQGSVDSGARDASVQSRDAGAAVGGGGTASASTDAGVSTTRDACAPLPCPSGAPWNPMTCSCSGRGDPPPGPECTLDSQCAVVLRGCCGCEATNLEQVLAVPKAREMDARRDQCPMPVACGPCAPPIDDPLHPIIRARCVEQKCQAVDLRSAALTLCNHDNDCTTLNLQCCGTFSDDPKDYVGVDLDSDAGTLQCEPIMASGPQPSSCPARATAERPISFCAQDGHCAVRRRERVAGVESATCYSPTQNLDRAYDAAAVGCDCVLGEAGVCRKDSTGRFVGLLCVDSGRWQAVHDGPCGKP
jgi:hypothetical protein